MSGSMGFNSHFANIVSALFLATGQDMAHIAEGSLGITEAEREKNGDLYFSVYLPDLMVGTVGGGTGLPTQKEALAILGLDKVKKGDSLLLAQIIGAGVLAGELSLTAALAAGHLARAHQVLGRGRK
jgi:hydroxymethylglutaryl-CoA reductase (NADPH)